MKIGAGGVQVQLYHSKTATSTQTLELDEAQHFGDAFGDFSARQSLLHQAERDILLNAHMREERVRLEHHVRRPLVRRDVTHVCAGNEDAALVGLLEPGDQTHQRRLAATGGPKQRKEFACRDVEADLVDRRDRAEAFRHLLETNERLAAHGHAAVSSRSALCSRVCRISGFMMTSAPRVFSMIPSALMAESSRVTCSRRQPMRDARM